MDAPFAAAERAYRKRAYSANRLQQIAEARAWNDAHPERHLATMRRYNARHPERNRAKTQAWVKANLRKKIAHNLARSKRVRQATPPWADMKAIRLVYLNCPPGYEVDHIHPIKGKNSCGLHVPWNLQYLPAGENARKHTRHPETADEGSTVITHSIIILKATEDPRDEAL